MFIGRALRPLDALVAAMAEVGAGRYRTRIGGRLAPELARLRDSFNRMAARLAAADAENRRLNEQLLTLQEQERSDLARDLHDEVSPFLFAISIDAATASRLLGEGHAIEAGDHVQLIAEGVRHMQRQVRSMLSRLLGTVCIGPPPPENSISELKNLCGFTFSGACQVLKNSLDSVF